MSVPHRTPEERLDAKANDCPIHSATGWGGCCKDCLVEVIRAAESEARSAAEEELKRLRVLENQVNWFDASTHHGEWDEADIETVREVIPPIGGSEPIDVHHVKPIAICRLCGHTPIEHYAARESEAFRRGYEAALKDTEPKLFEHVERGWFRRGYEKARDEAESRCRPLLECGVVHQGYERDASCIEVREHARANPAGYGDEYRAALLAGKHLCSACRVLEEIRALEPS